MKVIRYSFDAFKPQFQTFHMKFYVDFHLNDFDRWFAASNITTDFPHLVNSIQERHKKLLPFYEENYEDFKEGVWVFWDGYKNSLQLNHLKVPTPCFSAYLPDNVDVYDTNWEVKMKLNDPLASVGCYVPKRSLEQIRDIERVIKKKGLIA